MNYFEKMEKLKYTLFTELHIEESKTVHDSGYSCFRVIGYNYYTKEKMLLTECSDVIHLPSNSSKFGSGFSGIAIDKKPDEYYWRIFARGNYRIKVEHIMSDFMFSIVEVKEND